MKTYNEIEVTGKQTFIEFVELLHQDYLKNSAEWEYARLDVFLKAMVAYAEDIQGY